MSADHVSTLLARIRLLELRVSRERAKVKKQKDRAEMWRARALQR